MSSSSQISARLVEEKAALLKQCEDSVEAKAEETEQIKLRMEEAQQELLLTKNQVCFIGLKRKLKRFDSFDYSFILFI